MANRAPHLQFQRENRITLAQSDSVSKRQDSLSNKVFEYLQRIRDSQGAGYFVLIDPDRWQITDMPRIAQAANQGGADAILVGGSLLLNSNFDQTVRSIRENSDIPCILFPGSSIQISPYADAVLFLSLISGRNPAYLIGEQVQAAPLIKHIGLEIIPTGYMLIESGRVTSAEFMSNTKPIPRDNYDIAKATALAAEYLGMRLIYLEAGSGAKYSVTSEMITAVTEYTDLPVITGGGLREPEEAARCVQAGASFIVTGNILENNDSTHLIKNFADAIHAARPPLNKDRT